MKRVSLLIAVILIIPFGYGQPIAEKQNRHFNDSLIKTDKDFRYIHSLDSLLKTLNAEQDSLIRHAKKKSARTAKGNRILSALFQNKIAQVFFWMALLGFAGFVVYKLFHVRLVTKRQTPDAANEFSEDELLRSESWYLNEIHRAESENDFVVAVRCRFMRLLALLNDRELIEFLPGKTNVAYATEINDLDLKAHFRQVSTIYEYVWYGKKQLSPVQYESLKPLFQNIEKTFV